MNNNEYVRRILVINKIQSRLSNLNCKTDGVITCDLDVGDRSRNINYDTLIPPGLFIKYPQHQEYTLYAIELELNSDDTYTVKFMKCKYKNDEELEDQSIMTTEEVMKILIKSLLLDNQIAIYDSDTIPFTLYDLRDNRSPQYQFRYGLNATLDMYDLTAYQ